jgi:hypothetical protein
LHVLPGGRLEAPDYARLPGLRVCARSEDLTQTGFSLELVPLSNRQYVCPFEVAVAFAALGRHDDVFTWMNKGVAGRADCMIFRRAEPWLRPFRSDARYAGWFAVSAFPERSVSQ